MAERREHVTLKIDATGWVEGMRKAAEAMRRFSFAATIARFQHRRKDPRISAMHSDYDKRRRARRRKR